MKIIRSKDVLNELRLLVEQETVIKLPDTSDRLAWRPRRETVRYKVERQKERFEEVRAWKEEVLGRLQGKAIITRRERGKVAAKVRFGDCGWGDGEVRVRDPETWEVVEELLDV